MENGEAIVRDELNGVKYIILQFVICVDNSKSIFMDGRTCDWKDLKDYWSDERSFQGWPILPEPIIDRALDIRYFELTPSKIYSYMTKYRWCRQLENDDMDVNSNR